MFPLDFTQPIIKLISAVIIISLTAIFGMIGGCEYKQRQWDADKLASSEAARKLEKHDNSLGHRKIEQLGEDKVTISQAQDFVKKALESAPKKLVNCGKLEVVTKDTPTTENKDIKDETPLQPLLTHEFMQLYDVSINPSDVGLRGRSYETIPEIGVDEGFKLIERNNFRFAEEEAKLKRLQERICEKQKLYEQPVSKFCSN